MWFTTLEMTSSVPYVDNRLLITLQYELEAPSNDLFDRFWRLVRLLIINAVGIQMKKWKSPMAAPSYTALLSQGILKVDWMFRKEVRSRRWNVF